MWGRLQSARGFSPDSHSFGGAKNSAQAEAWLKPAPHFAGQTFAMNFWLRTPGTPATAAAARADGRKGTKPHGFVVGLWRRCLYSSDVRYPQFDVGFHLRGRW